ncbi:MAG: hypothetical protein U0176_18660 [Bacteroidia bacterium]
MSLNGTLGSSAIIQDFGIVLGERSSIWNREEFYLGDYFGGRTFANYDFAEVMVYDTVLTPAQNLGCSPISVCAMV